MVGEVLPETSGALNDEAWLAATRDGRDDAQRVTAGMLWRRMHLWATAKGLAMQPLNQINERADREADLGVKPGFEDALGELIGYLAWQGVFTFRVGN